MKKFLGAAALMVAVFANAQKFGITGGLGIVSAKAKVQNNSTTESRTAGYLGLFGDFGISAGLKFQPMANFVLGDGITTLQLPLLLKYYPTSAFNLQFGPQVNFDLESVPSDFKNYYNTTTFGLAVGAGYDFTPRLTAEARYNPQLTNSFKNTGGADVTAKAHYFNLGLGYKF